MSTHSIIKSKKSVTIFVTIIAMIATIILGPVINASAKSYQQYSGEQIFTGIFFGQGEIGKLLPEVWDQKDVKSIDRKTLSEISIEVATSIKKTKPDYFERLQSAVYSKDYRAVEDAINEGAFALAEIVKNDYQNGVYSNDKLKSKVIGQCVTAAWVFLNAAAVVEVFVFAVAVIVLALPPDTSALGKEQLIANLVDRINR